MRVTRSNYLFECVGSQWDRWTSIVVNFLICQFLSIHVQGLGGARVAAGGLLSFAGWPEADPPDRIDELRNDMLGCLGSIPGLATAVGDVDVLLSPGR
jgi:hypothetical protein